MKKSVLHLFKHTDGGYHTVFKTDHGRKIYLLLSCHHGICTVGECCYLDRSVPKSPKKLTAVPFEIDRLSDKISAELDKRFADVIFFDRTVTKESLISECLCGEKKHILLLMKEGNLLSTIFKNKYHRGIYLKIKLEEKRALIAECRYADPRIGDKTVVPQGLKSIYFEKSLGDILRIVNEELEGGFTDVAITEQNTLVLDRPICGRL